MGEERYRPTRARVNAREAPAGDRRPRQAMPERLSASLREARSRVGLTQRRLAEQVGVAQQTVSDWEVGRRWPGVKRIPRLAEVLRLDRRTTKALLEHAQPNRRKRVWVRRGKRLAWRGIHEPELLGRRTLARIDRASGRRGKGGRPKRRQRFTRR